MLGFSGEAQYDDLLNQYAKKSDEELLQITVDNGYTEIAQKAAQTVLNDKSNRDDYYNQIKENQERLEAQQAAQEKLDIERQVNPLYEDIHQIANDLRFIKNLIIAGLVCGGLGILVMFFNMIK